MQGAASRDALTIQPLEQKIRSEILRRGPIPFARFMELALYDPVHGYYERDPAVVGGTGDFVTSPSVGPVFGELLGSLCGRVVLESGAVQIVEAGAHDGRLALDLLGFLRAYRPDVFDRVQYTLVEPSESRRGWQRRLLADFRDRLHWVSHLDELPNRSVRGIILSNELLDAFPVHRFAWDARRRAWFEWGVDIGEDGFRWARLPATAAPDAFPRPREHGTLDRSRSSDIVNSPGDVAREILDVLPDGYVVELAPLAEQWWRDAARKLDVGALITFDYGFGAREFLDPSRPDGTLRAYHGHRLAVDPLANPGSQDLTAHVRFDVLSAVGEDCGLETVAFETQGRFLVRLMARTQERPSDFPEWTAKRVRQFQTLTHPEHFGASFRVLMQKRGDIGEI